MKLKFPKIKNKKRFIILTIITILLATTAGAIIYFWPKAPVIYFNEEVILLDEEGNPIIITAADRKPEFYNILVFGEDKGGSNTDTIMLFSLDVQNNKYNLMSIPRDTMANVSRYNKKINAAYSYGGIDNFYKELSDLIGFKPDRYIIVSMSGFERIINAMGGIDIDVAQNMKYSDPTQGLYINFQKGMQHMDGKQALEYVRFRSYPEGDVDRIRVQQGFVQAVVEKMRQPGNIIKIPTLIKECFDAIETDMTVNELLWLASKAKNISDNDQLESVLLPGYAHYYGGLSYYIPSGSEIVTTVNERFNPYTKTISSVNIVNFPAMLAQEQADNERRSAAEEAEALAREQEALEHEMVPDDTVDVLPDPEPIPDPALVPPEETEETPAPMSAEGEE